MLSYLPGLVGELLGVVVDVSWLEGFAERDAVRKVPQCPVADGRRSS